MRKIVCGLTTYAARIFCGLSKNLLTFKKSVDCFPDLKKKMFLNGEKNLVSSVKSMFLTKVNWKYFDTQVYWKCFWQGLLEWCGWWSTEGRPHDLASAWRNTFEMPKNGPFSELGGSYVCMKSIILTPKKILQKIHNKSPKNHKKFWSTQFGIKHLCLQDLRESPQWWFMLVKINGAQ